MKSSLNRDADDVEEDRNVRDAVAIESNWQKFVPAERDGPIYVTVEEAFQRVGGFGAFQKMSLVMNMLVQGGAVFKLGAFAFIEVEPFYKCQMNPPSSDWNYGYSENTYKDEFCAKEYYCEVDWTNPLSIHNIIE